MGRSKYQVSIRQKAITSVESKGCPEMRVEAEVDAKSSWKSMPGNLVMLSIAGPGLWSKLVMSEREAEKLVKGYAALHKEANATQTVHYPRKVPYGGGSWL